MNGIRNEEELKKVFDQYYPQIRDFLYNTQWDKELQSNDTLKDQSVRVYQRIRALLNIYKQIIVDDRTFDEGYLESYLGNKYSWNKDSMAIDELIERCKNYKDNFAIWDGATIGILNEIIGELKAIKDGLNNDN